MTPYTFKLFGFPIVVHGGFLLFLGVIALFQLQARASIPSILVWCLVVAVAFVVHELGHAFVARRFRLRVMPIELKFMVGVTPHQRTTAGKQLLISLAGPAAGLLLGLLGLAVVAFVPMSGESLPYELAESVLVVNLGLSLLNLLPIVPLDGGNALRSGVEMGWGPVTGAKVAAGISVVLGLAAVFFGIQSGMIFLAAFAGFAVWTNLQTLRELGVF